MAQTRIMDQGKRVEGKSVKGEIVIVLGNTVLVVPVMCAILWNIETCVRKERGKEN